MLLKHDEMLSRTTSVRLGQFIAAMMLPILQVVAIENDCGMPARLNLRFRRIEDSGVLVAENLLKIREALQILNQANDRTWNEGVVIE